MITLTFILICAVVPFIMVFVLSRVLIHFVEKLLDFVIENVFSLPEKILDSIKDKFKNRGKLPEVLETEK